MPLGHSRSQAKRGLSHKATARQADEADILPAFFHEGPHVSQYLPGFFFRQHKWNKGRHCRTLAAVL